MAAAPLYQLDAKNAQPALSAVALTPDNSNDLAAVPARFLYISVAGALKVDMADGSTVTFANVVAGRLDISVKRVWATGTTATGIVACY